MGLGDEHPDVVIVGAGVAGLYAGRCLHRAGVSVLIVEAQPRIGGRIRQVEGLAPWPVEVGPEFVHGSKSLLKEVLMDEMGCTAREKEWPDWYFLGSCRKLLRAADAPTQVAQLHDRFANVGKLPLPEQDESAEAWLRREGVPEEMVELADSCYANDFGCSLDRLGMRELVLENRRWDSGEEYFILDRSFSHMVTHLAKGLRIRTGWPVHRITYGPGHIALHGPGGQILQARRAICTVPLRILQQPDQLSFQPPLPPAKLEAANRIKMDRAIKVLVTVSERFWPPGLYDVVCTGSFVPEFWILTAADKPFDTAAAAAASPSSTASVAQDVVAVIAGFACGRHAERLASLRPADVVRKFLAQLDEIFGTEARRRPATRAFLRGHMEDWAQERFVDGAYSYPSVGAHAGDRDALATPVMNTLFFAGEATHSAINPCLQAAMETGERAALQVQDSLGRGTAPLSKLEEWKECPIHVPNAGTLTSAQVFSIPPACQCDSLGPPGGVAAAHVATYTASTVRAFRAAAGI